jgi:hypothetical protein
MLVFVTPPDVRSNFKMPPNESAMNACGVQTGNHRQTHRSWTGKSTVNRPHTPYEPPDS